MNLLLLRFLVFIVLFCNNIYVYRSAAFVDIFYEKIGVVR